MMIVVGQIHPLHYIADIRVTVPFGKRVEIPPTLAQRSRDLHFALQGGRVKVDQQLSTTLPATTFAPRNQSQHTAVPDPTVHQELQETKAELQKVQQGLSAALVMLKKLLEERPHTGILMKESSGIATPQTRAVGGETPLFIPEVEEREGSVPLETSTSSGDSVTEATRVLKTLRENSR